MHKHLSIHLPAAVGVLVLFLGLLFPVSGVRAHALLVRSLPAAGAELITAPATIEFWFSEPLESQFSTAFLTDLQGNEVGGGAVTVDAADPMHLTLALEELPPGIYTVVYRTLSQTDGHEWVGSFPLTVLNLDGTRPTAGALDAARGDDLQSRELPTPLKAISRWLSLLGAMVLAGVIVFQQIAPSVGRVERQAEPPVEPPETTTVAADVSIIALVERTVRVAGIVAIGLVLIGGWLQVMAQVATLDGGGGAKLDLFFRTRIGSLIGARQLLAGVLLFITILGVGFAGKARVAVWWGALFLTLAMLATFSLGSHAAAVPGSGWAVIGDFIHLVAAALWLGGLLLLAMLLWQMRSQPLPADTTLLRLLVWRFSALATLAVFVLVVTGLFSSFVQLHTLSLLWRTTYGWLLLAKVLLVGVALGIALLNHRLVRTGAQAVTPRRWAEERYRPFLRQVGGEALIGLGIMLVVALLVQTPIPPPAPLAPPPAATLYETILAADDLRLHLQISPNQVGDNRYIVHLYHANGSAIGEVQLVRLLFAHQTAGLGQASLDLAAQGGDFFEAAGAYLTRTGPWDLSIYVRRRGMDDLFAETTVAVPAPSPPVVVERHPWQNPIPGLPAGVVLGSLLVAVLLIPLLWRRFARTGAE